MACRSAVALISLAMLAATAAAQDAPPQKPLTEAEIARRLDERSVSFVLDRVPVSKALMTLASLSQAPMLLDPAARSGGLPLDKATVTLKAHDMPARDFLAQICKQTGLSFVIAEGLVFVTDRRKVEPVMKGNLPADVRTKLEGLTINFDVDDEPIHKVLASLLKLTDLECRPAPEAIPSLGCKVRFMAWDVSALNVLNWLCRVGDVAWEYDRGAVVLKPKAAAAEPVPRLLGLR